QKCAGTFKELGTPQQHPSGDFSAPKSSAVEQRGALEPRYQLDEAETVHRGTFVRPAPERGCQRVIDRAPISFGGERREVDADRTRDVEAAQRLGKRGYAGERER